MAEIARRAWFIRFMCGYTAIALLGSGGCTSAPGGDVLVRAVNGQGEYTPEVRTAVYAAVDDNIADVYLSDLLADEFGERADVGSSSGTVIHIHQFVRPHAGRTPIDETACSVSVRCVVFAEGEVGVYGGGGFLTASGGKGNSRFKGSIEGATLRLVSATPGFADRLGPSDLTITFVASRDDALSRRAAAAMGTLIAATTRVDAGAADSAPPTGDEPTNPR